jgi:hypothetical protein
VFPDWDQGSDGYYSTLYSKWFNERFPGRQAQDQDAGDLLPFVTADTRDLGVPNSWNSPSGTVNLTLMSHLAVGRLGQHGYSSPDPARAATMSHGDHRASGKAGFVLNRNAVGVD